MNTKEIPVVCCPTCGTQFVSRSKIELMLRCFKCGKHWFYDMIGIYKK